MMHKRRRGDGNHVYTEEGKPPSVVLDDVHITLINKPKKARVVTKSYGVKRTNAHPPLPDPPPTMVTNAPFLATEITSDNGANSDDNTQDPPQSKKVVCLC